jgi:hypothetical protein
MKMDSTKISIKKALFGKNNPFPNKAFFMLYYNMPAIISAWLLF